MYFVYAIQNKINLKIYIGYSRNPEKRWRYEKSASQSQRNKEYNSLLSRTIRKYGWNNFSKIVLEEFSTAGEALEAEKFWIEFFRTNISAYGNEFGYNRDIGGGLPPNHTGKIVSKETGKKISDAKKGKKFSQEHKSKLSDAKKGKTPPNKGIKTLDKTKKKISDSNRKLTIDQIRAIENDSRPGPILAKEYGVSNATISRIKNKTLQYSL